MILHEYIYLYIILVYLLPTTITHELRPELKKIDKWEYVQHPALSKQLHKLRPVLNFLSEVDSIFVDGTFKSYPKLLTQFFTIYALKNNNKIYIPMVFFHTT
jgi:hypothetical protein